MTDNQARLERLRAFSARTPGDVRLEPADIDWLIAEYDGAVVRVAELEAALQTIRDRAQRVREMAETLKSGRNG